MVQVLRQAPDSCGSSYSKSARVSLQPDDFHLMMAAAGEFLGGIMPECDSVLNVSGRKSGPGMRRLSANS